MRYKIKEIFVDEMTETKRKNIGFATKEKTIWEDLKILYTEQGAAIAKIAVQEGNVEIERFCQFIVTLIFSENKWLIVICDYQNKIKKAFDDHSKLLGERWNDEYKQKIKNVFEEIEKHYYLEKARMIIKNFNVS